MVTKQPRTPPKRRSRKESVRPPRPSIICAHCNTPIMAGQHIGPLFSTKLVKWSEHPILSKPVIIRGAIACDGSWSRTDLPMSAQLRQRAAMGGAKEAAEQAAFEELWARCIANAPLADLRKEMHEAENVRANLAREGIGL